MRRYYQTLNSGSTSEQRTGRTKHEYAQQRHFNALQDAAELQTVKQPLFTLSVLKPRVTSWAQQGLANISTPEMKQALAQAFARDGRFQQIRSVERQHAAGMEELVQALERQLQIENEPEDVEEIAAAGDGELVPQEFEEPDADIDAAALDAAPASVN